MKKEICPIADKNGNFNCDIALHKEENYENCHNCVAIEMYIKLTNFIEYLRKTKKRGKNGK